MPVKIPINDLTYRPALCRAVRVGSLLALLAVGCNAADDSMDALQGDEPVAEAKSAVVIGGGYFGLLTTEKYQDNWQNKHCVDPWWYPEQCYAWEMANGFGNIMDDHNTKLFSGGLDPATGANLQDSADSIAPRGADLVDVLYLQTHGGVYDYNNSDYAMWTNGSSVLTSWMRLGDDARGLKMFVSWSCNTMYNGDGNFWGRNGSIFRGGLKIMVGSHNSISWGYDMWHTTRDFAGYLQDPTTIYYAWVHPNTYAARDQDIAIAATGVDGNDCVARMSRNYDDLLYNVRYDMPVLRDNQIGAWCMYQYDDLGG